MNDSIQRIAVLSVHTCPLAMLGGKKTGGMNVYVRDFCRELGRRGVQVDVYTRSQDDCIPPIHELGDNARVIHVPAGPERFLKPTEVADHLDQFVEGVIAFAAQEQISYDLIHSHYWLSGIVAGQLRERWGRPLPIIHMFHTLGHMKNKIARSAGHRAPQIRIDGETKVIQEIADSLIAATPSEQEQLITLYGADPAKIAVIPPGVDPERFAAIPKAEAKTRIGHDPCKRIILLAARIEPLKGIDTLLRAVALVDECCHEILDETCVVIVGGDPWAETLDAEMERLQQLRDELAITRFVTFVGSKDQMLLPNYYAAADMVVMPSHYESFGLVALEAMMMGTPVIASEVGGLAHLVKDGVTGFHVPAKDPKALSLKIYDLLEHEALREKLGRQANQYAQNYAWSRIIDQMRTVYAAETAVHVPVTIV